MCDHGKFRAKVHAVKLQVHVPTCVQNTTLNYNYVVPRSLTDVCRQIVQTDRTNKLERDWRGPFYFAMGADPQLGLWDAWSRGACSTSGTTWERELALTHEAVRALNLLRPRPRFLALCGDLVHDMPGQPKRNEQMQDLRDALRNLDPAIPLVLVPGNHDLGNEPTTGSIESYRQAWGDDYFSFWVGGVRFLVLNSQFFVSTKACRRESEEHNNWLGKELAECTVLIILQHIPLFLSTPDEEDGYFNIPLDLRQQLIEKFQQAGPFLSWMILIRTKCFVSTTSRRINL
uniref:Calcineurin-like phosphoesterase domain containing 1 n=1 Tax=Eptatretus burgeri TaxID=7764 RepID=A0A8C4NIJ3_EPTBU